MSFPFPVADDNSCVSNRNPPVAAFVWLPPRETHGRVASAAMYRRAGGRSTVVFFYVPFFYNRCGTQRPLTLPVRAAQLFQI